MIDRVVDNAVFASLSEANLGPGCYGTFKNGRVEQFLDVSSTGRGSLVFCDSFPPCSAGLAGGPGPLYFLLEHHRQAPPLPTPHDTLQCSAGLPDPQASRFEQQGDCQGNCSRIGPCAQVDAALGSSRSWERTRTLQAVVGMARASNQGLV